MNVARIFLRCLNFQRELTCNIYVMQKILINLIRIITLQVSDKIIAQISSRKAYAVKLAMCVNMNLMQNVRNCKIYNEIGVIKYSGYFT